MAFEVLRLAAELSVGGARRARAEMRGVERSADSLRRSLEGLDRAAEGWGKIERGLENVRKAIRRTRQSAARPIKVKVELEGDREAVAALRALRQELTKTGKQSATVSVRADTKPALNSLRALKGQVTRLTRDPATVSVHADTAEAAARLRAFEAQARRTGAHDVEIDARADTGQAERQLDALRRNVFSLSSHDPTLTAGVRGVPQVIARLMGVEKAADRLDGRTVTVDVDSRGILDAIPTIREMAGRIRDLRTVARTVTFVGIVSSIGGLVGAATAAAGAVGQLSIALGQGLAGGAIAGAGALGLLYGSLGAYIGIASQSVKLSMELAETEEKVAARIKNYQYKLKELRAELARTKPGTEEYRNKLEELHKVQAELARDQRTMAKLHSGGAAKMLQFAETVDVVVAKFRFLRTDLAARTVPLYTRALRLLIDNFGMVRQAAFRLTDAVNAQGRALLGFVGRVQNLQRVQNILDALAQAGGKSASILRYGFQTALIAIQPILPLSLRLLDSMNRLAQGMFRWTASAEGMRTIERVANMLYTRFHQVLAIVRDFGAGLIGLFQALNATGGPARLIAGLQRLAASFREIMSEGGRGRKAVMDFMNAAQPALRELGKLTGTVVTEFLKLANNVVRAGQSGGRIGVLARTLRELRGAVEPIRKALQNTFVGLGPEIARLITNVARLMETMSQTGAMSSFLNTLNRILEIFNSLPAPVRNAVAQVAAWAIVLQTGVIGSTVGAVGALVKLIAQMILYRRVANLAKAAAMGQAAAENAGTASRLRAVASMAAHKAATLASAAATRAWTVAQQALNLALRLNPIGLVITALAALAVGLVIAYRRSETFRRIVNTVFRFLETYALAALEALWNGVKAAWSWISTNTPRVWNAARRVVTGALRAIWSTVTSAWNGIRSAVTAAVNAIRERVTSDWNAVKSLTQQAWDAIRRTVGNAWNGIRRLTSAALDFLRSLISRSWSAVRSATQLAWSAIRSVLSAVWNAIKRLTSAALNFLQNAISRTWNTIRSVTRRVWNAIKTTINTIWNAIKRLIAAALNYLRNLIQSRWSAIRSLTSRAWSAIRETISSAITRARRTVESTVNALRGFLSRAWEAVRKTAAGVWERIKNAMTSPMEAARDKLREVWNSILGGISKVLSAVGLKDLAEKVGGAKWAHGGTTERRSAPRGGRPVAFARGGVAFERGGTGGLGTRGANPRLHLWNEQHGNEAYIAEKRPAREQLPYLQTAASWFGYAVVPADPARAIPSGYRDFADGGLALPVRAFASGGVEAMYWAVKRKFGVEGFNRHGSYLSGAAARDSLDWMVTTPGTVATGAQKELGDKIAAFVAPPSTVNTIWYGRANFGSGWQPYSGGPGIGNANTLRHMDHVHAQAFPDHFRGAQGTYPGGGGFFSSLWDTVGERIWNATVQRVWDAFARSMEGGHVLRAAIVAAGKMILDGIKSMIIEKAGASSGGEWDGGGTLEEWITKGFQLSGAFPPTKENVQKYIRLAKIESGGNPSAVQQIIDVNSSMPGAGGFPDNRARGLMQVTPQTWEWVRSMFGADLGRANPNIFNPIKNVAARARNQKVMLGYVSDQPGYAQGGRIPGRPGEKVLIQAHAGEIVLPRGVSDGFVEFAKELREAARRGIPSAAELAEKIRRMTEEILRSVFGERDEVVQALRAEPERNIRRQVELRREHGERIRREALEEARREAAEARREAREAYREAMRGVRQELLELRRDLKTRGIDTRIRNVEDMIETMYASLDSPRGKKIQERNRRAEYERYLNKYARG